MELLLHLLHLIRWLDEWELRALRYWVPDLARVQENPAAALQERPIEIGPWRHYVRSGAFLSFLALIALIANYVIQPPEWKLGVLLALLLLAAATLYHGRGGRCRLHAAGVDFTYRGVTVFCPWDFFHTAGQPIYYADLGRLDLPVAPAALPRLEARTRERLTHGSEVRAAHFRLLPTGEVRLKCVYGVQPEALGHFLQELSRRLTTPAKSGQPGATSEPAQREAKGWVRVRLTRLRFPPLCCDCGMASDRWQEFLGYPSFLGGSFSSSPIEQFVRIQAPVCRRCTSVHRRRYVWTFVKMLVLLWAGSIVLTPLLGLLLELAGMAANPVVGIVVGFVSVLLVVSWMVAAARARAVAAPLQVADYRASEGTVRLRFRNAHYVEVFLEALRESGPDYSTYRCVPEGNEQAQGHSYFH